jgi:hypothetical protein
VVESLRQQGIVLEGQGSDPVEAGEMHYVGPSYRFRDGYGVFDPRIGGAGTGGRVTIILARNASGVTAGTYLRTADGMSTDYQASPPVIPFAATLIAVAVGIDGPPGSPWAVDVECDGVTQGSLSDATGTLTEIVSGPLSIAVPAGCRVGARMQPGSNTVDRPTLTIVLRE